MGESDSLRQGKGREEVSQNWNSKGEMGEGAVILGRVKSETVESVGEQQRPGF